MESQPRHSPVGAGPCAPPRRLPRVAWLTFLVVICTTAISSAASKDEQAVLEAERRWAQALVKQDAAALKEVYADDLVYVHSGGNRENKAEFIRRIETGGLKYESLDLVDPRVRLYGNVAI